VQSPCGRLAALLQSSRSRIAVSSPSPCSRAAVVLQSCCSRTAINSDIFGQSIRRRTASAMENALSLVLNSRKSHHTIRTYRMRLSTCSGRQGVQALCFSVQCKPLVACCWGKTSLLISCKQGRAVYLCNRKARKTARNLTMSALTSVRACCCWSSPVPMDMRPFCSLSAPGCIACYQSALAWLPLCYPFARAKACTRSCFDFAALRLARTVGAEA
jgi:hypothetical protein